MNKKFFVVVLSLLLVAIVSSSVFAQDTFKIGYACNNFNDTFQTVIEGYARALAEKEGVEYVYSDGGEDILKQQDQINAFIAEGVDALIVVPIDTSAVEPIIEAAAAAKIPLVFVNRNPFADIEPEDYPENVYFVGSEESDAGKFQAEYALELLGEKDPVGYAILVGMLSNQGAVARTQGNKDALEEFKNFELLAEQNGDWQRDQGMTITENWLTAYGDKLKLILANNDEMALGAVEATEAAGREDIIIMGVDLIPDAKQAIIDGRLDASVMQDGKGQGEGAMNVALAALKGEKPDPYTKVPFVLATPENIEDFE